MREWARGIGSDAAVKTEFYQSDPFDMSDADWGFYHPAEVVKAGYTQWRNSDFSRVPDIKELLDRDGRWLKDLNRLHRIVRFYTEADPITGTTGGY